MFRPPRQVDKAESSPASSRRSAKQYRYQLVDVFAERPFNGAPLAVFTDARGLDKDVMRHVARELNRPQTAFLFPHEDPSRAPLVRVFSSHGELPSAHYPSIGAAFALAVERGGGADAAANRMVFESADGPVSVSAFARIMTMRQAAPGLGEEYPDVDAVMGTLSLPDSCRVHDFPVRAASSGVPYLIVPLKNRASLQSIRFRDDIWYRTLRLFAAPKLLAFTMETDRAGSTAKMRVFTPDVGILEDPASESACGPLAAYLAAYGFISTESPQMLVFEQGSEVGRPAFLHVAIEREGQAVTSVRVGGQCVAVGEGWIVAPAIVG